MASDRAVQLAAQSTTRGAFVALAAVQHLAEAAGAADFDTLKRELTDLRARARAAFERAVPAARDG